MTPCSMNAESAKNEVFPLTQLTQLSKYGPSDRESFLVLPYEQWNEQHRENRSTNWDGSVIEPGAEN